MSTATLEAPQIQAPEVAAQTIAPHEVEVPDISFTPEELPRKRLISADDFMRMAEAGWFAEQRVELINGDIIIMPPISEDHAQSLTDTSEKLYEPLIGKLKIRIQQPFFAGDNGRPEPDIAVVRPESLNPKQPPSEALLLIEISRTTLQYDRTTKLSLYASLGISDYWIVNLIENQVEVHRQPIESASAQFGHNYASRQIYQRGQSISLLEVPEVSIDVDAMLPQFA